MDNEKPPEVMNTDEIANLYKDFNYSDHSISLSDFIKAAQEPNTVILDLRDSNDYKKGHIKGALHIGANITIEKLNQLVPNSDTTILVYCTNSFKLTRKMSLTYIVVPQIYRLGYKQVYYLDAVVDFRNDSEIIKKIQWEGTSID